MGIAELILKYLTVLAWSITVLILVAAFKPQIQSFLGRLQKVVLPGGISAEIQETKKLSEKAQQKKADAIPGKSAPTIPLNKANAIMLNRGLSPSPSGFDFSKYRVLAEQDPNLALAGLRMEIENILKNYSEGSGGSRCSGESAGMVSRKLYEQKILSAEQHKLITNIISLCNMAVHGKKVTREQAEDLIDVSLGLVDDYMEWLSADRRQARRNRKT
jgi:uncharacterized protein YbjQ (UPF0145 family)